MVAGRVTGTVVSTQKDQSLIGKTLLVVQPVNMEDLSNQGASLIAIDSVGAGPGELVIIVGGSSARMTEGFSHTTVDQSIVAILDNIEINGKMVYSNIENNSTI